MPARMRNTVYICISLCPAASRLFLCPQGGRVMEKFKATLMDEMAVARALKRISHEILEKNNGTENLCIIHKNSV